MQSRINKECFYRRIVVVPPAVSHLCQPRYTRMIHGTRKKPLKDTIILQAIIQFLEAILVELCLAEWARIDWFPYAD
ncbi:Uncharacterized protein APZ42_029416 [Daphnia magna]|uniref:Uncharacterized protein n=1 Tax=Daphnia magna TaxID=35525 RepID=A0A164PJ11_9CRUS|nr:Uncharacterized protein APZ42_029416 [Daphnia magna]